MDAILLLRKMQATNNLKAFKVGGWLFCCSLQKGRQLAKQLLKHTQTLFQARLSYLLQLWMTRFCKIRSGVGIKVHQTAAIRFDHLVHEISVANFILSQKSQKWFSSSKSTIRKIWNFCIIVFFIRHKVGNTGLWNWGWRHYPELSPKCLHFEWQSISFHQVLLHNS